MKASSALPARRTETRTRIQRLRFIAWLLDESIPLPGGFRIGIDAIIGLVPGIGDAIGALMSVFILSEARSLGAPRSVLWRMSANILVDTLIGSIPFAGDIFDAGFKANVRNLALLERYHIDPLGSARGSRWFMIAFSVCLAVLVATIIALPILIVVAIVRAF